MEMTLQEKNIAERKIHENRARELANDVINVLMEQGQLNYPAIRDAITNIAAVRFRKYDRTAP